MSKFKIFYIFPNLITAASIFTGILSILYSVKGQFDYAVYMIIISAVLDGLDGKVARWTNSTSKFGLEFDSLADTIAFGMAPALLVYFFVGHQYGKVGILIASLFVIFGAIRLARFNIVDFEPSLFIGLPIPASALLLTSWTSFIDDNQLMQYAPYLLVLSLMLSILMVSNIRYPSFKKVDLGEQHAIKTLVLLITLLALIYLYTIDTLLVILSLYTLWGILKSFYNILTRKWFRRKGNIPQG